MPNYNYKPIDQLNENMENLDQQWFKPKIDLKLLKELSKRRDGPGWINTIAYFVVLFVFLMGQAGNAPRTYRRFPHGIFPQTSQPYMGPLF